MVKRSGIVCVIAGILVLGFSSIAHAESDDLQKQIDALRDLIEVAKTVVSTLDLDTLLQAIMVSAMHYAGMNAMRGVGHDLIMRFEPLLFRLSIVIGVVLANVACGFAGLLRAAR